MILIQVFKMGLQDKNVKSKKDFFCLVTLQNWLEPAGRSNIYQIKIKMSMLSDSVTITIGLCTALPKQRE